MHTIHNEKKEKEKENICQDRAVGGGCAVSVEGSPVGVEGGGRDRAIAGRIERVALEGRLGARAVTTVHAPAATIDVSSSVRVVLR